MNAEQVDLLAQADALCQALADLQRQVEEERQARVKAEAKAVEAEAVASKARKQTEALHARESHLLSVVGDAQAVARRGQQQEQQITDLTLLVGRLSRRLEAQAAHAYLLEAAVMKKVAAGRVVEQEAAASRRAQALTIELVRQALAVASKNFLRLQKESSERPPVAGPLPY